jgi:hypothetical protein
MVGSDKRFQRRYLAKSYGVVALGLVGMFAVSQYKQSYGSTHLVEQGEEIEHLPDIPSFLHDNFKQSYLPNDHRRLEKVNTGGSYHGECTTLCSPTGGFLSLIGGLSGQCDCVIWIGADDEPYCKEGYENTCCGVLDNAGGVILYIAVVFYTFLALAVICDNYFCESLTRISAALKLSDDVAGATFMAAGSSAPELFT